jgi:hypothetical protein
MLDSENLYKQWYSSVYIALQKYTMAVTFTRRNTNSSGLWTRKEILLQTTPLALIPCLRYFRDTVCLHHAATRNSSTNFQTLLPDAAWNEQGQEKEE